MSEIKISKRASDLISKWAQTKSSLTADELTNQFLQHRASQPAYLSNWAKDSNVLGDMAQQMHSKSPSIYFRIKSVIHADNNVTDWNKFAWQQANEIMADFKKGNTSLYFKAISDAGLAIGETGRTFRMTKDGTPIETRETSFAFGKELAEHAYERTVWMFGKPLNTEEDTKFLIVKLKGNAALLDLPMVNEVGDREYLMRLILKKRETVTFEDGTTQEILHCNSSPNTYSEISKFEEADEPFLMLGSIYTLFDNLMRPAYLPLKDTINNIGWNPFYTKVYFHRDPAPYKTQDGNSGIKLKVADETLDNAIQEDGYTFENATAFISRDAHIDEVGESKQNTKAHIIYSVNEGQVWDYDNRQKVEGTIRPILRIETIIINPDERQPREEKEVVNTTA